jgi:hypothetical protein
MSGGRGVGLDCVDGGSQLESRLSCERCPGCERCRGAGRYVGAGTSGGPVRWGRYVGAGTSGGPVRRVGRKSQDDRSGFEALGRRMGGKG